MNFLLETSEETASWDWLTNSEGLIFLFGFLAFVGALCVIKFIFKPLFRGNSTNTEDVAGGNGLSFETNPSASPTECEIIAVIAAAIATAESESTNGAKFRVVSFRRK